MEYIPNMMSLHYKCLVGYVLDITMGKISFILGTTKSDCDSRSLRLPIPLSTANVAPSCASLPIPISARESPTTTAEDGGTFNLAQILKALSGAGLATESVSFPQTSMSTYSLAPIEFSSWLVVERSSDVHTATLMPFSCNVLNMLVGSSIRLTVSLSWLWSSSGHCSLSI